MRKILSFIGVAILICLPIKAQQISKYGLTFEKFENNSYTHIVQDSTVSKAQKLSNFKEWATKTFGDYKAVLQYEDADNCKLIIKGKLPLDEVIEFAGRYRIFYNSVLSFTLSFDGKDNKYRLKFENMDCEVVKTEETPLGNEEEKLQMPIIDYIQLESEANSFRTGLSASLSSLINSCILQLQTYDDF